MDILDMAMVDAIQIEEVKPELKNTPSVTSRKK